MNVDTFYDTLEFLDELDTDLTLQRSLDAIAANLTNLVNSPAQPATQSALSNSLIAFSTGVDQLAQLMSPSRMTDVIELQGADFFDPSLADLIRTSVSSNALTPSVTRDFVVDLATRRTAYLRTVRQTLEGLTKLGVTGNVVRPGSADLAFSIPKEIFSGTLSDFTSELRYLNKLLGDIQEAQNGDNSPIKLESLSSSVPTIAVLAALPVVSKLADIVNKFLEAWERIGKLRKVRSDAADLGVHGAAMESFDEQIDTTVTEVVEESTLLCLNLYEGEKERKNELTTALNQDLRRLFGQIERGLVVDFRAALPKDLNSADAAVLKQIDSISQNLNYPDAAKEPLLLTSGQIIEGEIKKVVRTSKTTTTKTTRGTK